MYPNEIFEMFKLGKKVSKRISSWDKSGGNRDNVRIEGNSSKVLADIEGPGIIKHIYFTMILQNPLDFRSSVIKMYWDDEKNPSVEVPFGDFFLIGNCRVREINSLMVTVNKGIGGSYGFNTYFPMPFTNNARIEIENQSSSTIGGVFQSLWYHIDYEIFNKQFPEEIGYFHAYWNREKLTKISDTITENDKNKQIWTGKNITGDNNYVILDTEGDGKLVGLFLCIDNIAGGWYGEGDDMIFIDDDKWPPSIHGTGTEEIFGGGASPQIEFCRPFSGFHLIENEDYSGNNAMYRWFIHDSIRFNKNIKWTIEHGHANNFENDYSSVAYWYQKEPHKKFIPLSNVEHRIPRFPQNFESMWGDVIKIGQELISNIAKLNDKQRNILLNPANDAIYLFMEGKYISGLEKLKKVNEVIKQNISNL
ncbi:MAG: glycoside hydrolase family 172 protein [Candidatus Thorarchaeota archaeon]